MEVSIRQAVPADITVCGQITYAAMKGINDAHGFDNLEFSTMEIACGNAESSIHNPFYYSIVAEANGQVIGFCFLDEHNSIRGVDLVCVDPAAQGMGAGRMLMETVLQRCEGSPGVRLLQHTFNTTSLALYVSLGFAVKEPLMLVRGMLHDQPLHDVEIRPMHSQELEACGALCEKINGFSRVNEIRDHSQFFTSFIALRSGRIVAYAAAPAMPPYNHIVAETEADMRALLLGIAASSTDPIYLLVPIRQESLFRWCLKQGLRVVKPYSLMALGEYQEPAGCYLPSVIY